MKTYLLLLTLVLFSVATSYSKCDSPVKIANLQEGKGPDTPLTTPKNFTVQVSKSTGEVLLDHSNDFRYKVFNMHGVLLDKSKGLVENARLALEKGTYWVVLTSESGDMKSRKVVVN